MLLEGKVVIAAGVGPGLGRATAVACAREGADVALAARSAERLDEVAGEIEGLGRRALRVPTDLREAADNERLVSMSLAELGRIDGIVTTPSRCPPDQRQLLLPV